MGLPRYILNLEDAMGSLLPNVEKEKIKQFLKGCQRCKGLRLVTSGKGNFEIFWKIPTNIYITGINMRVNEEQSQSFGYLDMYIDGDLIFNNVKDLSRYRNFCIFRNVKQNEVIKFIYHADEKSEKEIWFDIDYYIEPIQEVK